MDSSVPVDEGVETNEACHREGDEGEAHLAEVGDAGPFSAVEPSAALALDVSSVHLWWD